MRKPGNFKEPYIKQRKQKGRLARRQKGECRSAVAKELFLLRSVEGFG